MNDQATPSIQAMIFQINDAGWLLNNLYQSGADRDGRHQWRVNLRSVRSDTTTKFYTDPTLHGVLWAALQGVKDDAAGMGIDMTQEEAHAAVAKFRETYPEIPQLWYALDKAAALDGLLETLRS